MSGVNHRALNEKEMKIFSHFTSKKHNLSHKPMKSFSIIKDGTHFSISDPVSYRIDDTDSYIIFGDFTSSVDMKKLREKYLRELTQQFAQNNSEESPKKDDKTFDNIEDVVLNDDEEDANSKDYTSKSASDEEKTDINREVSDEDSNPHEEEQTLFDYNEDLIEEDDVEYLKNKFGINRNIAIKSLMDNNYNIAEAIAELEKEEKEQK